jgi:hypothetical protein
MKKSRYLDPATGLTEAAVQIVTDLKDDVSRDLAAVGGCIPQLQGEVATYVSTPSRGMVLTRPGDTNDDPTEGLSTIEVRLRRADTNFALAIDLLLEKRKTIAEFLAEIR